MSETSVAQSSGTVPDLMISILGPVRIRVDGTEVGVGPRLERVLAALVARRGEVVDVEELIDMVWPGDVPSSALASLRSSITRLRRALGDQPKVIAFRRSGYTLDRDAVRIDADLFEREVDEALLALQVADLAEAGRLVERAVKRWAGRPYSGLDDDAWTRPERVRLEERRAEALETWVEVMLASGRVEPAVALARSLVEDEPLRERPRNLLMRSMYLAGRHADAVRTYRDYRYRLSEETGLDPTDELAELETLIIRGELSRSPVVGHARGYELLDRIGSGAFSVVHRAVQPGVGREVAVKVIRGELANRPEFIRQFEREAQLIASIEHPYVVPLHDFWRDPGAAYLVMRLMRGGSLADALRERGPMSRDDLRTVLEQVGGALHTAHRLGVAHGDVRPANVLRDLDGAFYLADFGIAVRATDLFDRHVEFRAPEVLRGDSFGAQADIMSLGITVFQMLTARLPFADTSERSELVRRQLEEPLPSVRAVRTDLPERIDEVLARATSKVAADRYGSIPEFVDELDGALGHAGRRAMPAVVAGPRSNPYIGLHAFTEIDAERFHGRDQLIGELLDAIERRRLVVVVGPSGCGKSSVVRAGVLPAIRSGGVAGSDSWLVTTMVPGTDPVESLETALLRVAVNPPASLRGQLEEPGGLLRAIRRVLPDDDTTLLVVIDQFEELYTTVRSDEVRARFLVELGHALEADGSPLRAVATLRADHYDAPLGEPALAELVHLGTVAVRPMRPHEIEQAIVRPAQSVGVDVEAGLVAELVAGVVDRPASLPLLQFALTENFERRVADVMLLDTHASIGGLTGALAARAERIIDRFDESDRELIRHVFLRLTTVDGTADGGLRRRAPLREFGEAERALWVIDEFVRARLLVVDRDEKTRSQTLEVAHEALLRDWPRLREWIDRDREDAVVLRQVTVAAEEWTNTELDEGMLARGGRLELVSELARRRPDLLNEVEHAWVARSTAQVQSEQAAEHAAIERDRRQNRRLRRSVALLGVVVVLAVAAAMIALVLRNRAASNERAADARRLILEAGALIDTDPELAALLAIESIEAFRGAGLAVPAAAFDGLRSAVIENRVVGRFPARSELVDLSPDGSTLLTGGGSNVAQLWDAETFELIDEITTDNQIVDAQFVGDDVVLDVLLDEGARVLRASDDGFVDLIDGLPPTTQYHGEAEGSWFTAVHGDEMRVWDLSRSAVFERPAWSAPSELTYFDASADGRLAYADPDGSIRIVELATGDEMVRAEPGIFPSTVEFSPDGSLLAVLEEDASLTVLDAETGGALFEPVSVGPSANDLRWSRLGDRLLLLADTGIRIVDPADGATIDTIRNVGQLPNDLQVLKGSDVAVVTSLTPEPAALIDLGPIRSGRDAMVAFELPVVGRWIDVEPSGQWMTVLDADTGTMAVVDPATGSLRSTRHALPYGKSNEIRDVNLYTAPVTSLDGRFASMADEDGWSVLYDVRSDKEIYRAPAGWDIRAINQGGDRVLIHRATEEPAGRVVDIHLPSNSVAVDIGNVVRAEFTPDGRHIVTSSFHAPLGMFDTDRGDRVFDLPVDSPLRGFVDITLDGNRLFVGTLSGELVALDLAALISGASVSDATEFTIAEAQASGITPVLSDDGSMVATVGRDEPVNIWSTTDGSLIATLPRASSDGGVDFHPTEPWAYVMDGNMLIAYTLDIDELIELARLDVTRDMTDDECRQLLDRHCGS